MTIDDQLAYYERRVKEGENEYALSAPGIKQDIYDSRVRPYQLILRQVRLRAGLAICWGDYACLKYPDAKCAAGDHGTCKAHAQTCFLCGVQGEHGNHPPKSWKEARAVLGLPGYISVCLGNICFAWNAS